MRCITNARRTVILIRGFSGSAPRGRHQVYEACEVMCGVVRAGRGFRVILDGEDGQTFVAQSFDAVIVEIDVRDFDIGRQAFH